MSELPTGTVLAGRYQLRRALYSGELGTVYRARDLHDRNARVAVKVIGHGVVKSEQVRERFKNELHVVQHVKHRNVVQALDYFEEGEQFGIVLEYVSGGNLAQRMRGRRLPPLEVAELMWQTASGLEALHKAGVVHRDLKPENILLTPEGEVKISDFGLVRLRGASTLTQPGMMVGTPKYIAPEYIETGECDHRADIYALGVIAYELLCGVPPYEGAASLKQALERIRTPPKPIAERAPQVPAELAQIVETAMAFQVTRRYQSVSDLRADLERFLSKRVAKTAPPPSPKRLRRQRALIVLVITAAASVLTVLKGVSLRDREISLELLPRGLYHGVAESVLSAGERTPLLFWHTPMGNFVLLAHEGCAVAPLVGGREFRCGDLRFELIARKIDASSAAGIIRETTWGTEGRWRLQLEGNE